MGIRTYTLEQLDRGHGHALARRRFTTDGYNRILLVDGKQYKSSNVLFGVEAELARNGKSPLQIEKMRGEGDKYIFRTEIITKDWEIDVANPPPAIAAGKMVVIACLVPEKDMNQAAVIEDPYQYGPYAFYQIVSREHLPKVISVEEAPEVQ